jgi:hypothetical protein
MSAGSAHQAADMLGTQDDSQLSQALYEDFMKNGIGIVSGVATPALTYDWIATDRPCSVLTLLACHS